MRTRLSKYRNVSSTFIAAVGRRGTVHRDGVPRKETLCLEYLTTENQRVADHLWVPLTGAQMFHNLHDGDVILFKAIVLPYDKGYAGYGSPPLRDYAFLPHQYRGYR